VKPITVVLTLLFLGVLTLVSPSWLLYLAPLVAIGSAAFFYKRRRVPAVVYLVAVIVCGGLAGFFGMLWGAQWSCSGPHPGNQCFLLGVFVAGPVSCALAIFVVGLALSIGWPNSKRKVAQQSDSPPA